MNEKIIMETSQEHIQSIGPSATHNSSSSKKSEKTQFFSPFNIGSMLGDIDYEDLGDEDTAPLMIKQSIGQMNNFSAKFGKSKNLPNSQ
jgi:hypothetical protein